MIDSAGATGQEMEELTRLQNFGAFTPYIQPVPELVSTFQNVRIVEVAAGYSFSLAVTANGEVYSWGFNEKCQLGLGHRYNQSTKRMPFSQASWRCPLTSFSRFKRQVCLNSCLI